MRDADLQLSPHSSLYSCKSSQIHFGFLFQLMKPDSVVSYRINLLFIYLTAGTASAAGIHLAMLISADSPNVITKFINSFHHVHVLCPSDGSTLPHLSDGQPGVYTAIIKEVVGSLKADFDEFGVGEDVLHTLEQVRLPAQPEPPTLGLCHSLLTLTKTSRNGNRE